MTKAERAIQALHEAANALEDLPDELRLHNLMLGVVNNPDMLRREAEVIETRMAAFSTGHEAVR